MNSILNSENGPYSLVQHNSSCSLLPQKIRKLKYIELQFSPVSLYGCENWSVTMREEGMVREFRNRLLSKIFGSKMEAVYTALEKTA
jgi:hypothetical protein